MKKVFIIMMIVLCLGGCVRVKKYHSIYIESRINKTYTLYSGIRSYGANPYESVIEFQIHPPFTGTKEQCNKMIERNDLILDKWLNTNYLKEKEN